MSLKYALLAALSGTSKTGYDLANDMQGTIGLFWQATHQQIYKELGVLLKDGLLDEEIVKQTDKPDKRVYTINPSGLMELQNWIGEETKLYPTKDALLIKVFVGHLVEPQIIQKELKRLKKIYQGRLKKYSEVESKYFQQPLKLSPEMKFQFLTLRRGLIFTKSWLSWIEEAELLLKTF